MFFAGWAPPPPDPPFFFGSDRSDRSIGRSVGSDRSIGHLSTNSKGGDEEPLQSPWGSGPMGLSIQNVDPSGGRTGRSGCGRIIPIRF